MIVALLLAVSGIVAFQSIKLVTLNTAKERYKTIWQLAEVQSQVLLQLVLGYEKALMAEFPQKYDFLQRDVLDSDILEAKTVLKSFPDSTRLTVGLLVLSHCRITPQGEQICSKLLQGLGELYTEQLLEGLRFQVRSFLNLSLNQPALTSLTSQEIFNAERKAVLAKKACLELIRLESDDLVAFATSTSLSSLLFIGFWTIAVAVAGALFMQERYEQQLKRVTFLHELLHILPIELVESNAYAINFLKSY